MRRHVWNIKKAVGHDDELSAQADFTIAKTYEVEGHWDKALPVYKYITQKYPVTTSGFYAPMYLANHVVSGEGKTRGNILLKLTLMRWHFINRNCG